MGGPFQYHETEVIFARLGVINGSALCPAFYDGI